ncbi:Pumilio/Puf RNA-binding protein [Reticulomyxa filosa]|uniref:Pumilio/Puf RNA-binding protein n=1 Tax=Reticulomyxa filosa TaxID=46433 RepID=X6NWK1_RETFI|nr:Pumilio/Puf RNA-binding protein [Reticulomyxa filosa]|eukprot:ETO30258.1 Pumilio/Puf RNA-binding protein [Reticulomyxa filosa]
MKLDSRVMKQLKCELMDLVEHSELFLELCQDKYGSRYVQKLLEEEEDISLPHLEVLLTMLCENDMSVQLSQNVSGNYVIQKLLEIICEKQKVESPVDCNKSTARRGGKKKEENDYDNDSEEDQYTKGVDSNADVAKKKSTITVPKQNNSIRGKNGDDASFSTNTNLEKQRRTELGKAYLNYLFKRKTEEMATNQYSSRIVQRILRYDNSEFLEIKKIILSPNRCKTAIFSIALSIINLVSNHILQKCIEFIPNEYLDTTCKRMEGRIFEYAIHVYGCRILQLLMERCTLAQMRPIYEEILEKVVEMCIDQHANYVIQMMLKSCKDVCLTTRLVDIVATNVDILCSEKFASNVVEFCLTKCNDAFQKQMLDTLLYDHNQKNFYKSVLVADLVKNKYGNYGMFFCFFESKQTYGQFLKKVRLEVFFLLRERKKKHMCLSIVVQKMAHVTKSHENAKYRNDLIQQIQTLWQKVYFFLFALFPFVANEQISKQKLSKEHVGCMFFFAMSI